MTGHSKISRLPLHVLAASTRKVGVIADTHGLLRPEALDALVGVDYILHAGDIGSEAILRRLGEIAPTIAVRGNNDRAAWANDLNETERIEWADRRLLMVHDAKRLNDDGAEQVHCFISGHSHVARIAERKGVIWLNPGSAGPRRFRLPVSLAFLELTEGRLEPRVSILEV